MTFTENEEKRMWGELNLVILQRGSLQTTKGCGLTSLWFDEAEKFWNDKEAWLGWMMEGIIEI